MSLESDTFRDTMPDIIDGSMLVVSSPVERVRFGPGQGYASKGCFIVQGSKGAKFERVGKTDRVIH